MTEEKTIPMPEDPASDQVEIRMLSLRTAAVLWRNELVGV